jgi:hypothetical protein
MAPLASDLRRQLENVCIKARDSAEAGARLALTQRAVDAAEPYPNFPAAYKQQRNRLRARGRQVGDQRLPDKTQSIDQLFQELAYAYWHRMLFARFLAENNLLMHPDNIAVSLEESAELAKSEGAPNGFVLAARYASRMLPEIFRKDDILLEIPFAPEHRLKLEKLLAELPRETFLADDSLGWVYQFWQTKKKEEVNRSGEKIDARTLPVVTQLFTEHYMVQFLLDNTIGAWWCAKNKIQPRMKHGLNTDEEKKFPSGIDPCSIRVSSVALPSFEYLRWRPDGTPAAGTFDGWPETLPEVALLDPCCGSGHFLVSAFHLLVPLRMRDEGLSAREAADAVLRDNLFGLEIDPRCTQIAAFALALAAWKYPDENGQPLGFRLLPSLHLACTGIGPRASKEQWLRLADQAMKLGPTSTRMAALGREPIRNGLENLHALFSEAPIAGSLIDPNRLPPDLLTADYETLKPYLDAALTAEQTDDEAHEQAVAAAGMVKAAELLAREYTLVATNVPYLGRGKQDETLKNYYEKNYPDAKADLATCFVERCLAFGAKGGTAALVTTQNWLFLGTYKKLRQRLLQTVQWDFVVRLGEHAFESSQAAGAFVALLGLTQGAPSAEKAFAGLELSEERTTAEKAVALRGKPVMIVEQTGQLGNPDARIAFKFDTATDLLARHATASQGIPTSDGPLFLRAFWEMPFANEGWEFHQTTVEQDIPYGGRTNLILFENGSGRLRQMSAEQARDRRRDFQGANAWSQWGVAVSLMRALPVTLYTGEKFDNNVSAVVPSDQTLVKAIWAYCSSDDFKTQVRQVDQKLNVTNATLVKVPFDLAYWQKVALEKWPHGLPKPHSDDPTQWLFNGHPAGSEDPLQVAVARLLGYQWPRQTGSSFPDCPALGPDGLEPFADREGIVCVPAVRGQRPAAERLLELLRKAFEPRMEHGLNTDENDPCLIRVPSVALDLNKLLTDAGCKPGTTLDDWLRNSFFEQHCKRFHQRPFIWHLWDGRKDGFSCLVNYHRLNHKALENLTYAYLGDWIKAQAAETKAGKVGADLHLAAAQALQEKLKLILAGEPPYDIFVRWKPLAQQAVGWNPDLNDGVRMNIRPFVKVDVLRKTPNIKWGKDRGKEPERARDEYPWFWKGKEFVGDRVNDVHLTNAQKQAGGKITAGRARS